jgi:hypothetical protein
MLTRDTGPKHYGMVAEFRHADQILAAAHRARENGYTRMEGYTPFPVHGLSEALGFQEARVPWVVFAGGLMGAMGGLALQVYVSVFDYPLNVGGKPLLSLPAFIPVTFECTILLAALGAFFGMFAMNGLPKPYHPIFSAPNFERASQDRFFLCIEARDPMYDADEARAFMETLGAESVSAVDAEELVD